MSGHEHLSEDVLLDAVYGIADAEAQAHVRVCSHCAGRLSEWQSTRSLAVITGEFSNEFLAAQRKEIYARISEGKSPGRLRLTQKRLFWAPAVAAACALALGVFVYHPAAPPKVTVTTEASDAQLFTDVFSMEQSLEPSATAPVRALFEEQQ